MDIDEAVSEVVRIRDDLDSHRKEFKAYEADAKSRIDELSMWLRDKADDLGVDSFKTRSGTAYRAVKTSYRSGNWDEFLEWVKRTDNFQCLEKRVAKNATKEIHEDTGEVPPGVDYLAEVEIQVRRPSK